MSTDDESLLGAFLDGELETEQRLAVESSLSRDPHLAAMARGLASVRDLVAGLSRPTSPDVSLEVMRRVHRVSRGRRPWMLGRHARRWGVAAFAASALLAIVSWPLWHPGPHGAVQAPTPGGPVRHGPSMAVNTGQRVITPSIAASGHRPLSFPDDVFESEQTAGSLGVANSRHATKIDDQERVRKLLDDPHLRRVFLVTDVIGQPTEHQVASLVERTTHRDYFKFTLSQGIVVDPHHPGRATVFAVVLDENELVPFRDRLKNAFSNRLQEQDVDPAVAMQLADIGQVVALPANPIGDLIIPRSDLALRAPGLGDPKPAEPPPLAADDAGNEPTAEQERSSPATVIGRAPVTGQDAGNTVGNRVVSGDKRTGDPAQAPAGDDRHLAAAKSPDLRHPPVLSPAQEPADRSEAASAKRPLVVLVWIASTPAG